MEKHKNSEEKTGRKQQWGQTFYNHKIAKAFSYCLQW
jgi:hypothetical protein